MFDNFNFTNSEMHTINMSTGIILLTVEVVLIFFATPFLIKIIITNTCKKDIMLSDSVVAVVTGAEDGIGYEVAKDLARRGAKIVMGCQDKQKGNAAKDQIISDTGNEKVYVKELNLSSFSSVLQFAREIIKEEYRLDVLVNAAVTPWRGKLDTRLSQDGLPYEVQYNYFGPFLLILLLVPLMSLSKPSRIINITSFMYRYSRLNIVDDKLPTNVTTYTEGYANIKLAILLITVKWSQILKRARVTVNCFDAGYVINDFIDHNNFWDRLGAKYFAQTYKEAAQTPIAMAVMPDFEVVTGRCFCNVRLTKIPSQCKNTTLIEKLWALSLKTVKRDFCMHF